MYTGQTPPDAKRRGDWSFELSGGELEEGLPHPLYLLLGLGGYPKTVDDVQAITHLRRDYDHEFTYDGAKLQYVSTDDVLCSTTLLSGEVPEKAIHVHGETGGLIADLVSQTLIRLDRDYEASPVTRARHNVQRATDRILGNLMNVRSYLGSIRSEDWSTLVELDPHYYQFNEDALALLDDREPAVRLEEGGWTIRLLAAIRNAAAQTVATESEAIHRQQ